MSDYTPVSLHSLSGGEAIRRFDAEMEKVIENCLDPSTEIKKSRDIHLVVKFSPSENDRTNVSYEIICYSKLAREASAINNVFMSIENGKAEAYEQNIKQTLLPFPEEGRKKKANLTEMEKS